MILLSDVRSKLFDMSVQIASMSVNLRDSEMPEDAAKSTTETCISIIAADLIEIEEKMDALRKFAFRVQA